MDEFDRKLKNVFAEQVDRLSAPRSLNASATRRIVRRRAVLAIGSMAMVAVVVVGAAAAIAQFGGSDAAPEPLPPASEEPSCSEQDATDPDAPFGLDWTTSAYVIASGEYEEIPWIFCAALANVTHRKDNETEGSLCTDWKFGRGLGSGWTCSNALEHAKRSHYFERTADFLDEPAGAYSGAISDEVAIVQLHVQDGEVIEAPIYAPPPELGLDFRFFIGFVTDPNENVIVKVLDQDGSVLAQERFAALPMLTVTKRGSGEGTVTSTPEGWIDCGTRCSVALVPGASVTLIAEPQQRSTFVGWHGACTGEKNQCQITLGQDKEVIASFESLD
jgi:hypothetical protein